MSQDQMGLLAVAMTPHPVDEEEFNAWYDTEHIPEREAVPGFIICRRWINVDGTPKYLATYDLQTLGVLDTPAYKAIGGANLSPWSKRVVPRMAEYKRWQMDQILPGDGVPPGAAGGLLAFFMDVDPEHEAEFNEWYNSEHVPALAAVPGVLSARRFIARLGEPRYGALYHLTGPEVVGTPAWQAAVTTPWSDRIRPLTRNRLRLLYRAYSA